MLEDYDDGVIEVQVIPQDDNWGETATTITETATSYCSELDNLDDAFDEQDGKQQKFTCPDPRQAVSILLCTLLAIAAILSPVAFILLPILLPDWSVVSDTCTIACEGMYISMGVKGVVLMVGLWALYVRPSKAFLPRINIYKAGMMVIVYIVMIFFWLFYVFRVVGKKRVSHQHIVSFSTSFLDAMLFLHYLGLILMWLRHQEKVFSVSVVRNVDGMRRFYNVGQNSIQKTAVYVLERYYIDFTEYNPYMPRPTSRSKINSKLSGLKLYDLDGKGGDAKLENLSHQASKAVIAAAAVGRRKEGRNDRFYEEQELDRRIRKRRARLVAAAEEAFGHIARLNSYEMTKKAAGAMDTEEASQAIFPTLARPLQKYLRTTRQQLHFPLESIMKHLSHCITFDLSARAFVQRYINDQPCVSHFDARGKEEWTLICDISPSRQVTAGTVFQLKNSSVSIVVVVGRAPVLRLREQAYNNDLNKFILRLNSETSV